MRAELKAVYGPDNTRPYTHELLRSLPYTEMVMKEILRFRPPAPLVPHISSVDFPLTPDYTIPKGTIVFPSLLESSFQVCSIAATHARSCVDLLLHVCRPHALGMAYRTMVHMRTVVSPSCKRPSTYATPRGTCALTHLAMKKEEEWTFASRA